MSFDTALVIFAVATTCATGSLLWLSYTIMRRVRELESDYFDHLRNDHNVRFTDDTEPETTHA